MQDPPPPIYYPDFTTLATYMAEQGAGHIMVGHYNCEDYEGMVLVIMISFDTHQHHYDLDLEWSSFGLDFYGDTLQESYCYRYDSLELLLDYLRQKHSITVTGIPINYRYDYRLHPSPIKDEHKRPLYEEAWQRFTEDFRNGKFLDPSLQLVRGG